jgi:hypothetical protein
MLKFTLGKLLGSKLMRETRNQQGFINIKRRRLILSSAALLTGAAIVTVFFTAPASLASGGGGGGDGGERDERPKKKKAKSKKKATSKKKTKKKAKSKKKAGSKVKQISTSSFLVMSSSKLKELRDSNNDIQIGGYSVNLSNRILEMAIYDRRNTRTLVRDMTKLDKMKDTKARRKAQIERLIKEHNRMVANETSQRAVVNRLEKDAGSKFDQLLRKKNPNATDKALKVEKTRMKAIKKNIKNVDWWKRNL